MSTDLTFRIAFAIVFFANFTIMIYVRRTSERSDEKISSSAEEGKLIFIPLRLFALSIMAISLLYIFYPRWTAWSTVALPEWLRWAGAGLGAAVAPLSYWAASTLGSNRTSTVAIREEHELVTSGPYRWVRHPLYTIGVAFFSALSLLAANWYIGLALLLALVVIFARTAKEEARLVEHFGDDYRDYQRRTGRFFPRLMKA